MASKKKKTKAASTASKKKSAKKSAADGAKPKVVKRKVDFVKRRSFPPWTMTEIAEPGIEIVYEPSGASSKLLATPTKVLEGHSQFVQALAFSPDGQLLVTGSEDGTVRVWDIAKPESEAPIACIKTASDHGSAVNGLSFTADGKHLLTASDDYSVKVWSVPAFEVVRTLQGHTDYVSKVFPVGPAGSGSTRALSSGKDGTLRLWDLGTGECLRIMDHGGWISALGVSHDGRRAVAGSDRNVIRMWDLTTGNVERVLLDASTNYIGDVMGFTLSGDNRTGVGHTNAPKHIIFSPDDLTFISSEKDIIVWDTATGAEQARMDGDGWPMGGVVVIPDRSSSSRSDVDPAERIFLEQLRSDPDNLALRSVYGDWLEERGRLAEANGVRRHGPSRHLFVAGHDKVHIFDLSAHAIVAQAAWSYGDSYRVAVSPDGRWGACGSSDGAVGLWDLDALLRAGLPDRHLMIPSTIAISQDGIALTGTSDRTVRLWSADGKTSERLPITEGLFLKVAFTLDGGRAIVMSDTSSLSVFDSRTGAPCGAARFTPPEDVYMNHSFNAHVFLRDGRLLSGSISSPLMIWPIDPPGPPEVFDADAGHVIGLAVDEDADLVVTSEYASGDAPMPIKFWSLSERKLQLAILAKVDSEQYICGLAIVDADHIVATTSVGGLIIFDRKGTVLSAIKLALTGYFDSLMTLPNGKVVVGGTTPYLIDVFSKNDKTLVSRLQWSDGDADADDDDDDSKCTYFIKGTTRGVVTANDGIASIDFASSTLSAFTPAPGTHNLVASLGGEFFVAITTAKDSGRPMVLRALT